MSVHKCLQCVHETGIEKGLLMIHVYEVISIHRETCSNTETYEKIQQKRCKLTTIAIQMMNAVNVSQ